MTVIDIKTREADKHALDAHYATDALANADALDQIHKRCTQLTEIYKAEIAAAVRAGAALSNKVDEEDRLIWLGINSEELANSSFGDFASIAQNTRERVKGGY